MKEFYRNYLLTEEWEQLRSLAMKRAFNNCELCGKKADHVHHIKYPKNFKADSLNNLLAVCKTCHDKLHGLHEFNNGALIGDIFNSLADAIHTYMSGCKETEGEKDWYIAIKNIYNDHIDKVIRIQ